MAANLQEAVRLLERGNLSGAEEKFTALYREDPGDAEVNYYLGLIAFRKDQYDKAVDYLNKAIALNGRFARAYEALGQALGLKAQHSGMVKALRLLPKVRQAFEKALELDPQSVGAREGLFMFYLFSPGVAGGNEKKALELLEELSRMNPARAHLARAMAQLKKKAVDEAENEYRQALQLAPEDPDIRMKAAMFFLNKGDFEQALEHIKKYIELVPDSLAGQMLKGNYYQKKEEWENALDLYNQVLERNPDFFPARFERGQVLLKLGREEEAIQDFQAVAGLPEETPLTAQAKEILKKRR